MIDDPPHIIFTNHTPQGDVGSDTILKAEIITAINITPRKGTENLPCQRVLPHHSVQDHTPQGDTGSCPALLHSFVRRSEAAVFL